MCRFLGSAVRSHQRSRINKARLQQNTQWQREQNFQNHGSSWTRPGASALGGALLGGVVGEVGGTAYDDGGESGANRFDYHPEEYTPEAEGEPEPVFSGVNPTTAQPDATDTMIGQYTQLLNAQAFWGPLQTCASMPIG